VKERVAMIGKLIVTAAGLLLIGGVNWYFLFSQRKKQSRPRT
jgi:plastocyanin domain-containing protein